MLLGALGIRSYRAQAAPDTAYQAERQQATDLFDQHQRLAALPLLEELVRLDPKDDTMLVDLAACLVDHAATLTDEQAAGQERFRARELLDRAWQLGNITPLAMNLSELLSKLPQSGAIKFSDDRQVEQAMRAGEAAFAQRHFDEAIQHYAAALKLDANNYSAALFIGNSYDRQDQFSKATEWYQQAIRLDPNIETAYRYQADMVARQGDLVQARALLIDATVAEPYNRIVWRELHAWATLNNTSINSILVGIPPASEGAQTSRGIAPEIDAIWQAYRGIKTRWQTGDVFAKHFPAERVYRHSLPEEAEALNTAAQWAGKLTYDEKTAALIAGDPNLDLLLRLYRADMIEPYILFSLGDTGIARDYASYRLKHRAQLEKYLGDFVVPMQR